MSKIRIAVLCSGGGTNFQAIVNASDAGMIPDGEVKLVITDHKEAFVLTRAARAGIKAEVADRKDIPERAEREKRILEILEENEIEFVVFIPSFCGKGFYGLHVHEAVLAAGVKVTGATVHYVTEVCDGGKIIAQKAVEVKEGDTPEILQKRVMREAEWVILPEAVQTVCKKLRGN